MMVCAVKERATRIQQQLEGADEQPQDEISGENADVHRALGGRLRSTVYEHFTIKTWDKEGRHEELECKYCHQRFRKSRGTSIFKTHLKRCMKKPASDDQPPSTGDTTANATLVSVTTRDTLSSRKRMRGVEESAHGRKSRPALVAPVRAPGITTSNPFAPTDRVICSTSHHVLSSLEIILHDQSSRPQAIPLEYLKKITDSFSDERILGQGGFGVVYKGVLQNGKIIAVKKIVPSIMPGPQKQFENEVYHLVELKHANIVRCVGYCYEIKNECLEHNGKYVFAEMAERLLCLEYVPNGGLNKYISDGSSGLDWSTRYKIIDGICHGLCYLHEQNGKPMLHLDLKPANILLDDGMAPKIADLGLSRLLDQQQTIYTNSRDGTRGYMAPEFLDRGTITTKSDIFSLGVIIMEVVTGHRDYPDITRTSSDNFVKIELEKWRNVLQRSPGYGSLETNCEQINRCLQVGLICVNPDRTKRPPITKVIHMLQGSEIINSDISKEAA